MSTPNDYDTGPDFIESKLQEVLSAIQNKSSKTKIDILKKAYLRILKRYNETVAGTPITPYNFNE